MKASASAAAPSVPRFAIPVNDGCRLPVFHAQICTPAYWSTAIAAATAVTPATTA